MGLETEAIEWMFGLGITFGLGMAFMLLTYPNFTSFLIWSMVWCSFTVEAHLLPLWVFVALFVINILNVGITYFHKSTSGGNMGNNEVG